jgi:hypothetical protein
LLFRTNRGVLIDSPFEKYPALLGGMRSIRIRECFTRGVLCFSHEFKIMSMIRVRSSRLV